MGFRFRVRYGEFLGGNIFYRRVWFLVSVFWRGRDWVVGGVSCFFEVGFCVEVVEEDRGCVDD